MTNRCVELVKKFEGFSSKPYLCPAGYWTIGYGHVIYDGNLNRTITKEEAEKLLIEDLLKFEKAIKPLLTVKIHDYMLDSLISFTFNVGIYAFKASTLRRLINRREFLLASEQFERWVYAGGKKLKGLVLRRQAEKNLYLEGLGLMNS